MEQIKDENLSMRRQIDFQQEKYFQLGTAYKKTRNIVHDMKNHYFAISEMLKQQQTEQLDAYLHSAINDIEANYISVNSGNLVLDAFISSFQMLAKENNLLFPKRLHCNQLRFQFLTMTCVPLSEICWITHPRQSVNPGIRTDMCISMYVFPAMIPLLYICAIPVCQKTK